MKASMYLGTYSLPIRFGTGEVMQGKGKGIHAWQFDTETGALLPKCPATAADNPSFVTVSRDGQFLYAVNELKTFQGDLGGAISAYAIETDGSLRLLSQRPTRGMDPCHVALDEQERIVIATNYSSGSLCVYPLLADGSLGEKGQFITHDGSGPNTARQEGPHAHSAVLTPDGKAFVVCDLGADRLVSYPFNEEGDGLALDRSIHFQMKAGTGPRFCAFDSQGKRCYVVCELTCEVWTLLYQEGRFTPLQRLSTLGPGAPQSTAADLHLAPDGRFLYVSNRGEDSIVVFRIETDGTLTRCQTLSSYGHTPRQFTFDPTGRWILVGNQDSDSISIFAREETTGALDFHSSVEAPTPVCLCFASALNR